MNTDGTYRMVVLGAVCLTTLCSAPPPSHAVSPSHGEIHLSQPPKEAETMTRRPIVKTVVNTKLSIQRRLPAPKVGHMLPSRLPVTSIQATSARTSRDEPMQVFPPMVSKRCDPTNVVSTKSIMSNGTRPATKPDARLGVSAKTTIWSGVDSPSLGETPAAQPPIKAYLATRQDENRTVISKTQPTHGSSKPAVPPHPLSKKSRLPSPSTWDTNGTIINEKTGGIVCSHSASTIHVLSQFSLPLKAQPMKKPGPFGQAMENTGCSTECPKDSSERPFECPKTGRDSIPPGEVREGQCTYVADKINKTSKPLCSPEPSTALTPSNPLPASPMQTSPPHVPEEPAQESEAKRHVYNVIVKEEEEMSAIRHSQEETVALSLPTPSSAHQTQSPPALPMQTTPIHHELLLSIETAPKRRGLLPIHKSAEVPSRGVEGTCLARAATYIQEHLSKHSPVHNTSPPGDMEEPPSKAAKAEVGQRETDAIREGTTRATEYVPYAKAAPTLPISLLAHPTWANCYHKPTSEPKCNGCAPDLPSMSVTPMRPNNDLIFNKVIAQPKDAVCSLV
jgi:hypothetical protein